MKKPLQFFFLFLLLSVNALAEEGPDLVVVGAEYEANQLQYQQFEATLTLKNVGSSPIEDFNVTQVYFSEDETWDEGDVYGGFVSFTNLGVDQSITLSIKGGANQFGIDANSVHTYLIVRADYRQEVEELDEDNNFWTGPISIRNASVDLTVSSIANLSSDVLLQGEMLNVSLTVVNEGTDNVHNAMYEYFLSPDEELDATDTKIGYLNWIGFYWKKSAVETDELAIPASLAPAYYHLFVRINTEGQEITINDYNLNNNVVKLFKVYVTNALDDNTLNFNEEFGAKSWNEDGLQWSWDDSGWDNIRDYDPRTGSGHAMSAAGYSSRLSTSSLLDIKGLWVQTSGSDNFTHLKIEAYDQSNELVNTTHLNPDDYEGQYKYLALNWEKVKSIRFDFDAVDDDLPAELFYDDIGYVSVVVAGTADKVLNNKLLLFPNPGNGYFNLTAEKPLANASVRLLSIVGQEVLNIERFNGGRLSFDLTAEPAGIYILEITQSNRRSRLKLIKR